MMKMIELFCVCLFGTSGRIGLQRGLPQGENTVFFSHLYINDHFTKTGSGQTSGKLSIARPFCRKVVREEPSFIPYFRTGAKNACYLFAMPLYTQNEIVLTRQARDKHRGKHWKKRDVCFSQQRPRLRLHLSTLAAARRNADPPAVRGKRNVDYWRCCFFWKNTICIYQDRLGTHMQEWLG